MRRIFTFLLSLMAFATAWAQGGGPAPTNITLNGEVKEGTYGGLTIPLKLNQGGNVTVDFYTVFVDGEDTSCQLSVKKQDDGSFAGETDAIGTMYWENKGDIKIQLRAEFEDWSTSELSEPLVVDISAITGIGGGTAKDLLLKTSAVRYTGTTMENLAKNRDINYFYDANNGLAASVSTLTTGSILPEWSINTYDEEGRVLTTRTDLLAAYANNYTQYEYTADGKTAAVIKYNTHPTDASKAYVSSKDVYVYTAEGYLEKIQSYNGNFMTGELTHSSSKIYSDFDANGRPATLSYTRTDETKPGVVLHLTYDDKGNLLKSCADEDKRGTYPGYLYSYVNYSCEEWTYDNESRVLTHTAYNWKAQKEIDGVMQWPKAFVEEFVYDDTRNCVNVKTTSTYGGEPWAVNRIEKDEYSYNPLEFSGAFSPQGLTGKTEFQADVTNLSWFAPKNSVGLTGYNIYQNGEKLNDAPVTGTSYVADYYEDAKYFVQGVYGSGENVSELNISDIIIANMEIPVREGGAPELKILSAQGPSLTLGWENPEYVPEGLTIKGFKLFDEVGIKDEMPVDGEQIAYKEEGGYSKSIAFQVAQTATFYVRTYYTDGSMSDLSNPITYNPVDNQFPSPVNVRVLRAVKDQCTLAWDAPTDQSSAENAKVTGYSIYISTSPDSPISGEDPVTETSYTFTTGSLRSGEFAVRATYTYDGFNQNGEKEEGMKGYSRKVYVELNETHQIATNLKADADGTSVTATWDAPESSLPIESYNVYVDGKVLTTSETNSATFTLEEPNNRKIAVSVNYLYKEEKTESPLSDEVTLVTSGIDGITVDASGRYNVYNVAGVRVMSTTDKAEIARLKQGMYIINNKKFVVK